MRPIRIKCDIKIKCDQNILSYTCDYLLCFTKHILIVVCKFVKSIQATDSTNRQNVSHASHTVLFRKLYVFDTAIVCRIET